MTKRQLIDEIRSLNHTAGASFLAKFADGELCEYLEHLQAARRSAMEGSPSRHEKYFRAEDNAAARDCPSDQATATLVAPVAASAAPRQTEGWLF